MTDSWALVDSSGVVVNLVAWDGVTEYSPPGVEVLPWVEGADIGELYPALSPADTDADE